MRESSQRDTAEFHQRASFSSGMNKIREGQPVYGRDHASGSLPYQDNKENLQMYHQQQNVIPHLNSSSN